jgi:hypothetical protein
MNGAGKTAVLRALCRLFGASQTSRKLRPTDFHVPLGEKLESREERELMIEARLDFPELIDGIDDIAEGTIPPSFEQMVVSEPGSAPYCRIRLEGKWTQTGVDSGDIEEKLWWITSSEADPEGCRINVRPHDRARIQVHYVPASRDTATQLANVSGTMLHELLSAVKWTDEMRDQVKEAATRLHDLLVSVPAVDYINSATKQNWNELYTDRTYSTPSLSFTSSDLDDVLKNAQIVFGPSHENADHDCRRLSEGQQSLFYFAFINTIFTISRQVYSANCSGLPEADDNIHITDCISCERLRPSPLTVFAVEEPENHLGPYYLGRVMKQLSKIADNESAQVVLTSHSASIVSRVDPEKIRYLRMDNETCVSEVKSIVLPSGQPEACKFVKEAVRTFPELYFARLVILCEGDSEELLLPKLAASMGEELDLAFISVVPLGGRYVNHLWRLLTDLHIPFVTLLDLDRERKTGGWATIKYVLNELLALDDADEYRNALLTVNEDSQAAITNEGLASMHNNDDRDTAGIEAWCRKLRSYDIFFSEPLDLDFMMLKAFPAAYQSTVADNAGPDDFENGHPTEERVRKAVTAVLGKEGGDGSSYSRDELELFPWYTYLFYGRGKPTTHTLGWLRITELQDSLQLPEPIQALMNRVKSKLSEVAES